MVEGMENEGMGKGGVMEGCGLNRRVLLVLGVSSLLERVLGGE